jgi:hypothetical protein
MRPSGLALLIALVWPIAPSVALAGGGSTGWYRMEPPAGEASSFGYGVLDEAPLTRGNR